MWPLIRFEGQQLLRAPSLWMVLIGCLALGVMVPIDEMGPGMQVLELVAPYRTQYFMALSSLIIPLLLLVSLPLSFQRDIASHFESVALCFPWQKRFWPKWFSVLAVVVLCQTLVPVGILLGTLIKGHGSLSATWLFATVLPAWFLLGVVNAWVMLTLIVWANYRWRGAFTPYAVVAVMLLLFWLCQALTSMPLFGETPMVAESRWTVTFFLDPFGMSPFFHETRYWTVPVKNRASFPVTFSLVLNRMVWLGLAAVILARTLFLVQRPIAEPVVRARRPQRDRLKLVTNGMTFLSPKPSTVQGFLGLWLLEWRLVVLSRAFAFSMLIWTLLCVVGLFMFSGTFSLGVAPRLPSTSLILSYCAEPSFFFGLVIAVVFSAQMLWRERLVGIDGLWNSLPLGNGQLLFAKYLALLTCVATTVLVMIAVGLVYQWSVAYDRIDYSHWLRAFYTFGLPVAVHGTVIFVVQTLTFAKRTHSLTGMAASVATVLALVNLPRKLHWEHPLLNPFAFPNLLRRHSELRGYGPWGDLFDHAALLWTPLLLPLFYFAWRWWPRPDTRRQRQSWALAALGFTAFLVMAGLTAWQYRQTAPPAQGVLLKARAAYEKRFEDWADKAVPQVIHSQIELDLYPRERRLEVRATATLSNTLHEDITTLLITARSPLSQLTFGVAHKRVYHDAQLNVSLIELIEPWPMGERLTMSYATTLDSKLFDPDPAIDPRGSYFLQTYFEPVLGYFEGLEIRDPDMRASLGLSTKSFSRDDQHTRYGRFINRKRTFDIVFSTSADQVPLTSGDIQSSIVADGRRTTHFTAAEPIYPVLGYFSGDYETETFDAQGIPVTLFTHPGHGRKAVWIRKSIRAAMAYCSEHFGPYPYQFLTVVEIPSTFPTGGRASAGVVALNESGLFMLDPNPGPSINTQVRRTVHEVVHQWFGEKLVPKIAPGEKILNESLTKYVEAMIVRQVLGQDMVKIMNEASVHRYFAGRSRDPQEAPLVAGNEAYLAYGKGGIVFQSLAEVLGEQRLNSLLHSFLEKHRQGMTATMPQWVAHLLGSLEEEHHGWIESVFFQRVTYDFRLEDVAVEKQGAENYLVLRISADCRDSDDRGELVPCLVNLPVTIGWGKDRFTGEKGQTQTQLVSFNQSSKTYRLKVENIPDYVVIDPWLTRLERERADNIFVLEK